MKLGPTSARLLVVLAVVAAAAGWGLFTVVLGQTGRVLGVPWLSAGSMWLLAGALAMAASRTGALVAGGYLGVGLAAVAERSVPSGQQTMLASFVSAAGAIALTGVALWLEHLCRLTQRDDDGSSPPGRTGP